MRFAFFFEGSFSLLVDIDRVNSHNDGSNDIKS